MTKFLELEKSELKYLIKMLYKQIGYNANDEKRPRELLRKFEKELSLVKEKEYNENLGEYIE